VKHCGACQSLPAAVHSGGRLHVLPVVSTSTAASASPLPTVWLADSQPVLYIPYALHLQVGHQAVECPNGTVNWKGIYGEDAFVLRPPVYESQLRERRRLRTCDEDAVRKAAEQYAKVRRGFADGACSACSAKRVARAALEALDWWNHACVARLRAGCCDVSWLHSRDGSGYSAVNLIPRVLRWRHFHAVLCNAGCDGCRVLLRNRASTGMMSSGQQRGRSMPHRWQRSKLSSLRPQVGACHAVFSADCTSELTAFLLCKSADGWSC
jgi:hypothetical protein